ncbi:MAG: hypothetical protein ABLT11_11220 [Candidatus Acidiferrum sp.]
MITWSMLGLFPDVRGDFQKLRTETQPDFVGGRKVDVKTSVIFFEHRLNYAAAAGEVEQVASGGLVACVRATVARPAANRERTAILRGYILLKPGCILDSPSTPVKSGRARYVL